MSNTNGITHIIWDWNGTLLNDVDLSLWILHKLSEKVGIPKPDREKYLNEFTFPVIHYYEALGFDASKEAFDELAVEWMKLYLSNLTTKAGLHEGARDVLDQLNAQGRHQSILSAYEHGRLVQAVDQFGITECFQSIHGLDNYYGSSKIDLGKKWFDEYQPQRESVLMFGDTLHDLDVANELGIHCALIADGHYSEERLRASGATVLDSIRDVPEFVMTYPMGND